MNSKIDCSYKRGKRGSMTGVNADIHVGLNLDNHV